jgi:hypothetical protein
MKLNISGNSRTPKRFGCFDLNLEAIKPYVTQLPVAKPCQDVALIRAPYPIAYAVDDAFHRYSFSG